MSFNDKRRAEIDEWAEANDAELSRLRETVQRLTTENEAMRGVVNDLVECADELIRHVRASVGRPDGSALADKIDEMNKAINDATDFALDASLSHTANKESDK